VWIKDHSAISFYDSLSLSEEKLNDNDAFFQKLLVVLKSHFFSYTIYPWSNEEPNQINAFLFTEETNVTIPSLDHEQVYYPTNILCVTNDIEVYVENKMAYKTFKFGFNKIKEPVGLGSKVFNVVATIRDEYRIKVYAESEQEAIDMAFDVPICEWEHPDIEPDLLDRQIIRYARWGNLSAKQVE
jgi:hypothetical protein